MNPDTWNGLSRYTKQACRDAFKSSAQIRLCQDPYAENCGIFVDGRRRDTIAREMAEAGLNAVPASETGLIDVSIDDALRSIGPYIDTREPHFPSTDDFRTSQLRKIITFFSTPNMSDSGTVNSFYVPGFGSDHVAHIFKHPEKYYTQRTHDNKTFAISRDKFDSYLSAIKEHDFYNARNYDDNVSEYLKEYGIADGRKLLDVLNNGLDGVAFGEDSPDNAFENFTEDVIRRRMTEVGHKLKELDKTLTLLQFADITLKKSGGSEHIHSRYLDRVKELVDKTYSGIKGRSLI